jgi:phosphate transport system substrate-binding protein
LLCFGLNAIQAQTTDANALSKAREIGTKSRASKKYYTKVFDLSGLPKYQPNQQVSGTIRQWGNNYLQDSGLSQIWEDEFRKFQPNVRFEDNLSSSAVAFPGLIPMGRQALWDELKGFEREGADDAKDAEQIELVEITMATGSLDVRGWTWALGIFVHKDNPLIHLTLEQLDGIFGAERSGGWNGLTWETSRARGKEKNIRTWGQLGLKGEWKDKPINVYGYNFKYHFTDEFDKSPASIGQMERKFEDVLKCRRTQNRWFTNRRGRIDDERSDQG